MTEKSNIKNTTMNRESFVKDSSVNDFIQWLSIKLDAGFIHSYTDRRTQKVWDCISIYDAYKKYQWGGKGFQKNAETLDKLSSDLKNGIENKDTAKCSTACLEILRWGGVLRGNREKIKGIESLVQYLKDAKKKLATGKIESRDFYKEVYMNSGFTKIYSLYIDDFIIYDSRVGAALGFLVRRYCEEKKLDKIPELLRFAYGNSKGGTNRNPSIGDYKFPLLRNAGYYDNHIENNLKANWLLKEVLSYPSAFKNIPEQRQLRALEAALFMIGYEVPDKSEK